MTYLSSLYAGLSNSLTITLPLQFQNSFRNYFSSLNPNKPGVFEGTFSGGGGVCLIPLPSYFKNLTSI